jgi:hypothetical protein
MGLMTDWQRRAQARFDGDTRLGANDNSDNSATSVYGSHLGFG